LGNQGWGVEELYRWWKYIYGRRIQNFIGTNTGKLRPVSALYREGWSFIIGGHACRRRYIHGRSPSPG